MGNYNELVPRRERIPIHNKRIRLVVNRTIHIFRPPKGPPQAIVATLRWIEANRSGARHSHKCVAHRYSKADIVQFGGEF